MLFFISINYLVFEAYESKLTVAIVNVSTFMRFQITYEFDQISLNCNEIWPEFTLNDKSLETPKGLLQKGFQSRQILK